MLTHEEREIAVKAVALAIKAADRPRSVLMSMVAEDEFGLYFPFTPQNTMELAREAVKMCEESQWDRVPPWLQQILSKVTETQAIKDILDKIATPPPKWSPPPPPLADPFDALWLPAQGLPFLGRAKLRRSLRRLSADTGPSVLIINGPPKSGKTYCVELLYHAARARAAAGAKGFSVAVVTLQRGMGASLSPTSLARMIVSSVASNPSPLETHDEVTDSVTPDRLNMHLCKWVIKHAAAEAGPWWVVLDGLEDPDLPSMTRNFISKLSEMLSEGPHSKALRLIVIDYPPELLTSVPPALLESDQLGPIGEVDLEAFLLQQLTAAGGTPPPANAIKASVALAMINLPEDDTRLKVLNEKLRAAVRKLSEGNGDA